MKKLIATALFALCAFAAFSQGSTWSNGISLGFTVPVTKIGVDEKDADDITKIGYGIEGSYIGYHKQGFTVKADVSLGLDTSKDFDIQDKNTNFGVFNNVALGAGYSFVRTEKVLFGATAMLALDLSYFSYDDDEKISGLTHNYKNELAFLTFSTGADVFGSVRLGNALNLFANVGVRYIVVGNGKIDRTDKYEKDNVTYEGKTTINNDLKGKFLVQPTLGIIWRF